MEDRELEELKAKVRARSKQEKEPPREGVSTGVTLLNLALTGNPDVGLYTGCYYLLVGDSQAGKTWLTLQCFAEAARNQSFDGHDLIFDEPERGALMDQGRYFGSKMMKRLKPPSKKGSSVTIDDFYANVERRMERGTSFVYALDSEDALKSPEGTEGKKGYNTDKARANSNGLRAAHGGLADTGSILIVIKQTRDNIGWDATFNPKTRSGGKALTFYATSELWFAVKGKLKKTVRGNVVKNGSLLKIHVKKNRGTGLDREVLVPFYVGYGLDDVGSMVDYLIHWKHWKGQDGGPAKGRYAAPEFDISGTVETLVRKIEEGGLESDLRIITARVWKEVEGEAEVVRKRRYE